MANKNRDAFKESTRRELRDRVAGRCSNPDCRVQTLGPRDKKPGVALVGEAAHITAAAPGGARWNGNLSTDQRRHYDNGIWLCSLHAGEVDANESKYSETELRRWKLEAEDAADKEKGKRLPSETDALNQITALFGNAPAFFVHSAIPNTHKAMSAALSKLDPRVDVKTSHVDGQTSYELVPIAPIEWTITATGDAGTALRQALSKVLSDGEDVDIPLKGLAVEGSDLFKALINEASAFSVGAIPQDAALRMHFTSTKKESVPLQIEFQGEVKAGQQAFNFIGTALGGALRTRLRSALHNGSPIDWSLDFSFGAWSGQDVTRIPHIRRAHKLFTLLAAGARPSIEFEVNGQETLRTTGGPVSRDKAQSLLDVFRYLEDLRQIAEYINAPLQVMPNTIIAVEDIEQAEGIANTIRSIANPRKLTRHDRFEVTLRLPSTAFEELRIPGERLLRCEAPVQKLVAFGQTITIPALTSILSRVQLKAKRVRRLDAEHAIVQMRCIPGGDSFIRTWPSRPKIASETAPKVTSA